MTSMMLSPAGPDAKLEVEVTLEDQRMINRFARLNQKVEELEEKHKDLKRQLDNVEEATQELMLADDDDDELGDDEMGGDQNKIANIHFHFGDAFMAVNKDQAEALLEGNNQELQAKAKEIDQKLAPMKEEMSSIKAKLYAKFGSNINLDHDDE